MPLLINNLLPRFKRFAQKIELKESLVDKVWVIYGDADLIEYEFERNGEIAVSRNGNSYDGTWKILGSGRLKIKTDFTNNTLEYDFTVEGLLVLKLSGVANQPFLLFNPQIVEDGDIIKYLDRLEGNKTHISLENEEKDDWSMMVAGLFTLVLFVIIIAGILARQNN